MALEKRSFEGLAPGAAGGGGATPGWSAACAVSTAEVITVQATIATVPENKSLDHTRAKRSMSAHLAQPLSRPSVHRAFEVAVCALPEYKPIVAKLYPLVDVDACSKVGIEPLTLALYWVSLGVGRLQVRAKSMGSGAYLELLRAVVSGVPAGVEVFANDRPDLAELAGCFGVHVGQSDLPIEVVKQTFPRLRVGVSTHDLADLERALAVNPDYVAFGPVFATGSKVNPEPCVGVAGLELAQRRARSATVPLVAIGGIQVDNIGDVAPHCDFVALIGALTSADLDDVQRRYTALMRRLCGASNRAPNSSNAAQLDE